MTEDTRKDKRAKIVSLNVRYKSATVDEFIENHSHDVSKGGLFIKTPTPFPPGTLIKFEIRIAGDKPVIMGVGRVVWKRDPSQSNGGERPSGMGVKFIKIDDSSRSLIDRVVAEKEGAGSAYATESETGTAPAARTSERSIKDVPSAPGSIRPGEIRKETYIGLGASQAPPKPDTAPPAAASPMFPGSGTSEPETGPRKEQTVMKQAAELLEEALREAGGSMEDVGTNPLFAEGNKLDPRIGATGVPRLGSEVPSKEAPAKEAPGKDAKFDRKATLVGVAPAPTHESSKPPSGTVKVAASEPKQKVASDPPNPSVAPKTTRETPSAKSLPAATTSPSHRPRASEPAPNRKVATKAADIVDEPAPKKSGGGAFWVVIGLAVVAGVAFVYKDNILAVGSPVPPTPTTVATTAPPPAPTPTPSAAPEPAPSASAAPSAYTAPSASAVASASSKAAASAAASAAPPPAPTPKPTPPTPTAASTPTVAPTPKPKPASAPTPAATSNDTSSTPAPAPKPKPKPKPADDDNPY